MAKVKNKKFNWRNFVSLYMTFAGIIIAVSGIILYIAPAGRIANWTHLSILGLEKAEWQALHIIFTFTLLIATGFHIYYNWRPLVAYFRTKFQQKISLRKELWISSIVTIILIGFTLNNVPPFSTVIDFGEDFKDSWATEENEPPVPHAEEMTLKELAEITGQQVEKYISDLKANGIEASDDDIIQDLADEENLKPSEIYKFMQLVTKSSNDTTAKSSKSYQGLGYGRMSLEEVCPKLGVDIEIAIQRLQEAGIMAQKGTTLKDMASAHDLLPLDLTNIIKGENVK